MCVDYEIQDNVKTALAYPFVLPENPSLSQLQEQIQCLHTLLQISQKRIKELEDNTESENQDVDLPVGNNLPEEVLHEIFRHLDHKESLLNSRLVCSSWANAIDSSPALMRQLTFDVCDSSSFLDSPVSSKVKSIRFQHILKGQPPALVRFFKSISHTVEKVTFDFPDLVQKVKAQEEREKLMFAMLMEFCQKLEEITIESSNRRFLAGSTWSGPAQVKSLVMNVENMGLEEVGQLKAFVLSLCALTSVEFFFDKARSGFGNEEADNALLDILTQHIESYPGTIKKIRVRNVSWSYNSSARLNLLTIASQHGIDVDLSDLFFSHKNFLSTAAISKCPRVAHVTFDENLHPSTIRRLGNRTELNTLALTFKRTVGQEELRFVSELKNLKELQLFDFDCHVRDSHQPPALKVQAFSPGIPSLETLQINGDIFGPGSAPFAMLSTYFPSVTRLRITNLKTVPQDLFCALASFENLTELEISYCRITDEVFTQPIETKEKNFIPVVAAFKSLKKLDLSNCPLLTDTCITNGIQRNATTLEKVVIRGAVGQFSEEGLGSLEAEPVPIIGANEAEQGGSSEILVQPNLKLVECKNENRTCNIIFSV